MTARGRATGGLSLDASGIELLAARIARLVAEQLAHAFPEPSPPERRLLTASEVSQWWGVRRAWVYAHAAELGAVRIGDGERPRLRFDPERVEESLRSPGSSEATHAGPSRKRSTRIRLDSPRLDFRADPELSSLSRGIRSSDASTPSAAAAKRRVPMR
jgi:hypothetical protein